MSDTNFQELRDQWALKAPMPSKDLINTQAEIDRMANPHNDPYLNKRPRRSETEIICDIVYQFADGILLRQYGNHYSAWLRQNCEEKWGYFKYVQ